MKEGEILKILKKTSKIVNDIVEQFVAFLFFLLMLVVFLQVIGRYITKSPIMWTEEMARFLLVMLTSFGISKVSETGDHLGVFFIRDRLKGRVKTTVYLFNLLITLLFMGIMVYAIARAYIQNYDTTGVMMLWFKIRWLYAALFFGSFMMLIYTLRDFVQACVAFVQNVPIHADGYSSPFPNGYGVDVKAKEGTD